jgi:hypothetical protein
LPSPRPNYSAAVSMGDGVKAELIAGCGNEGGKRNGSAGNGSAIGRWKSDPIAFVREVLINPETGQPFELYPEQERFFREALTPRQTGACAIRNRYSARPRRVGKTAGAAMAMLYVIVCIGGPYAEGYCVAKRIASARIWSAVRVFS